MPLNQHISKSFNKIYKTLEIINKIQPPQSEQLQPLQLVVSDKQSLKVANVQYADLLSKISKQQKMNSLKQQQENAAEFDENEKEEDDHLNYEELKAKYRDLRVKCKKLYKANKSFMKTEEKIKMVTFAICPHLQKYASIDTNFNKFFKLFVSEFPVTIATRIQNWVKDRFDIILAAMNELSTMIDTVNQRFSLATGITVNLPENYDLVEATNENIIHKYNLLLSEVFPATMKINALSNSSEIQKRIRKTIQSSDQRCS